MKTTTVHLQIELLRESWNQLTVLLEDYAKQMGLTYSGLMVLDLIYSSNGPWTQKQLCEKTFLPKQTINSIITGFYRKGLIELHEIPEDRRNKAVVLTMTGNRYAEDHIRFIQQAELQAIGNLDTEQRELLVKGTKQYMENFQSALKCKNKCAG